MNFYYPVICHYEEGSYWSEFPDLSGCYSDGENEIDIIKNSRECLEGYILTCLENGMDLPDPTPISEIKTKGKDFVSYIECGILSTNKSVRKNVTLPEWLNKRAEEYNLNCSKLLQDAIISILSQRRGES